MLIKKGNYMREMIWKCSKCKGVFTDKLSEAEDDDRCPLCKMAFSQMPYEPPHEIADRIIIQNLTPRKE